MVMVVMVKVKDWKEGGGGTNWKKVVVVVTQ